MLKRCCFCLTLHRGSLFIAVARMALWVLLFLASLYVAVQIFSPDSGLVPYQARVDIEQNSYVLFLIMLFSILGIFMESVLLDGLLKVRPHHINYWYTLTIIVFLLSLALALNFILGILEIPSRPVTGKNFVFDAFCVLFHIVFFFLPEYLFGPRLTPVLIALMIIVHVFLPLFHLYSFLVVRSFYAQQKIIDEYMEVTAAAAAAEAAAANGYGEKKCKNLCQKCQLAAMEGNGGGGTTMIYKCSDGTAIETTC